jgi:putative PIN family toxin of toxin-antitoxin system
MRLVLDTNVVVSATLWRGATYQFLELVRQQSDSIRVFASAPLLTELADVLVRPAMSQRLAAISRNAADVLGDYAALVEIVEPVALQGAAPDPDDDVVVATALAARADFIVTGDKGLLGVGRFGQVKIISVADATARLLG